MSDIFRLIFMNCLLSFDTQTFISFQLPFFSFPQTSQEVRMAGTSGPPRRPRCQNPCQERRLAGRVHHLHRRSQGGLCWAARGMDEVVRALLGNTS